MSTVKVNTIDKRTGSTLTLGGSGTAVTLASGATQTGFGRTGTVDWQTTPKTGTFTAVNGEGYFVNTSGGVSTANLPAGSAGAIVSFSDYTRTFATNNLTIAPNGSEKVGGVAQDVVLNVNGQALTLVYVDGTEGWINVQNAEDTETGVSPFVEATGGTITTVCTNYKVHTFTSSGNFVVTNGGEPGGSNTISYMVAGGGAGGGKDAGGGGGAGGFREGRTPQCASYTASPLNAPAGLPVSAQSYPIIIGAGGAGSTSTSARGSNGSVTSFSSITSAGGGGGGSDASPVHSGGAGGSGGGARANTNVPGGAGNTPPVSPPQGNKGGNTCAPPYPGCNASGGGGATVAGVDNGSPTPSPTMGDGGAGATTSINGSPNSFAGGGGGPNNNPGPAGAGGTGGGGKGGGAGQPAATDGTANTGGGAGGGYPCGKAGGSGVVIIRYKFQ